MEIDENWLPTTSERDLIEKEEARRILGEQIAIKGELIGLYERTAREEPNQLIRQMLGLIGHDSRKHIMMLNIILDFLEGKEVYMQDRKGLASSLKEHLELERMSIQNGKALLRKEWLRDRKGYRTIIENWVEDERRHHVFLKELSDKPFIPINSDDLIFAFRDEEFLDERYRRSKTFWEKSGNTDH